MAIKIKNSTIIDDSRVIVNASKVGVGTTNPTPNLFVLERNRSDDADTDNWVINFASSSNLGDGPGGVAIDSQNNIYVVGAGDTSSTGNFTYKGVIGKFSSTGSLIWQKNITNTGITSGYTTLMGVAVDTSDNVYITGRQKDNLIAQTSLFTAKLNSSGTLQWQSHLGVGNSITDVGSSRIYSEGIGIGTTGDVYVVGLTSTASNERDALIVKYNNSGTLQWQKRLGVGTNTYEASWGIGIGSTGLIYVGGRAGISTYAAWFAALDSSGNIQWQRYIGDGTFYDSAGALGIGVDSSDNVYVTGSENSGKYGVSDDFWIAKFNKTGTIQWQKYISGDSSEYYPSKIAVDENNNLYFSGVTYSSGSPYPGTGDLALFKFNSSGDLQWQRAFGGSGYEDQWWEAPGNTAVKGNKVVFGGYSDSQNGNYDITIASLTTDGDFIGDYGSAFKIVGLGLTVGISTWVVGVSTLTVYTSTLNTTAFDVSLVDAGFTSSFSYRLPFYVNPSAEIQGKLKVNIINSQDEDGNLGIGTTTPVSKLSVAGTITEYTGDQYWNLVSQYDIGTDPNQVPINQYLGQLAFLDQVPVTTVNTGRFDTGITSSVYVSVTSGIGTNDNTNRDIFVGPGIGYSFPTTPLTDYVIESIHITNKAGGDLYLSARHDYSGGAKVPIANRVVVPYQGALELLSEPAVASYGDIIRLQALSGVGTDATGQDGGLDAFITYSQKNDATYVGVGTTVRTTDQEIYTSSTTPTVLQSLRLANYNNNVDVDVSVSVFRGGTVGVITSTGVRLGYLAYNLTVPKNSVVELLEKPKYLLTGDSILVTTNPANSVGVCLAGKIIT